MSRGEEVEEMRFHREDEMTFATSIAFLKGESCTQYTPLLGSFNQWMREIGQSEACEQEWSALIPAS